MTRLTQADIQDIPGRLEAYDDTLLSMTGTDLAGVGCRAYDLDRTVFREAAADMTIASVPVTWGLGIIGGFAESVRAIAAHLGFNAFVTAGTDVAGFSEAAERGADLVLLSDDDDFQAIHFKAGISVDNSRATGRVFAAALDLMACGLDGKKTLVIGCGPVGRQAGLELLRRGAVLCLADSVPDKALRTAQDLQQLANCEVHVGHDLHQALLQHQYILEATPAAGIIDAEHVAGSTLIAAPGVPLGLTPRAIREAAGRLLHDKLQLGVAAMLAAAIKGSHLPSHTTSAL